MTILKVGVIGLGIGRAHIRHWRALPDRFQVTAVCDLDKERVADVSNRLGARACHDMDALLAEDLDVIDICTPPHTHAELVASALKAGCHVVCEKPLVNSLSELDAMAAAAAAADRHVMPISQYRFAPGIQRLQHLVAAGIAGEPYVATVETHWHRDQRYYAAPWRGRWDTEQGGVLLCHALHLHDLLTFVMGDVRSVFAALATRVNPIETEDCAAVSMTMVNGALVTSSATLGSQQEISRLRFCFENLTAESSLEPYNPGREPWQFQAASLKVDADIQQALTTFVPPLSGFGGQFIGLHDAITERKPLPVTLSDARRGLELVTAMYHSSRTGSQTMLPIGNDHPLYADWRPPQA